LNKIFAGLGLLFFLFFFNLVLFFDLGLTLFLNLLFLEEAPKGEGEAIGEGDIK
jgi:hypothetical protein